ncbi:hypothetical protein, variant 2 [Phytophthora nicotianae]|uniref:Uncharacterized protein n=1 Tax=Phytophthora nicotianae TaxID=4792 RepID=W2L4D9_PHYNI|nr:hypothetical protein L917_09403 [Phytophthora nicotianae]ETL92233.1 hypothetical protein, variant 1 [Phytophthora nicotianae]ETL92234.1 hypothetical protein, variant 2 [Phytophthora nicotianae]
MEGGRGGGRGKGKKSKAAKKKAAATSVQAAATHKKAAIGAKKVTASHPNVQVGSAAPEPASTSQEQPMTKSKRKRLKKQAAAEALKAAKKSPTAASASPKTKVAVLTPPAAVVKPHVVSLTGGKKKKKKRKLSAVAENSGDTVASTTVTASTKEGQVIESTKSPVAKKKKAVAVLGHAGASPTADRKTKTSLLAASPTKSAQVQHANKMGNVTTAAAPATASPRKTIKKLKAKDSATASPVLPPKEGYAGVKKPEAKTETKQPEVVGVTKTSVMPEAPKATKPETVTSQRKDEVTTTPFKIATADQNSTPDTATSDPANSFDTKPSPESIIAPTASSEKPHTASIAATDTTSVISESASTLASSASPPLVTTMKSAPSPLAKEKASDPAFLPSGGLKRRRSIGQTSVDSVIDPIHRPAKRNAVASKVELVQAKAKPSDVEPQTTQDIQSKPQIQDTTCIAQRTEPTESPKSSKEADLPTNTDAVMTAPSVSAPSTSLQPTTLAAGVRESVNQHLRVTKSASEASKSSLAPECKAPSLEIRVTTSKFDLPAAKQAESTVKVTSTTAPKKEVGFDSTTKVSSEIPAQTKKAGIIMDSHAYVEKMMRGDRKSREINIRHDRPAQPTVTLPPRLQNAWGASFGMVPPTQVASQTPRTLSTTPLSSWFLSKGCANFVKQVHFSDDDAEHNCDDEDGDLSRQLASPRGVGIASPKRRASSTKKNTFLESLTKQSNWRTWYGNVDVRNLLDPPLAHVPENVRKHEVKPLALPELAEETQAGSPLKKTNDFEMLEADIRREKQRGLAFSEQLLMMLQGKTVSGKLLEEEYMPLLNK